MAVEPVLAVQGAAVLLGIGLGAGSVRHVLQRRLIDFRIGIGRPDVARLEILALVPARGSAGRGRFRRHDRMDGGQQG